MRGLRQFDDIFQIPPNESPSFKQRTMSYDASSPDALSTTGSTSSPVSAALPSEEEARALCDNAIIQYSAMLRVVHLPTFYKQMDRIYKVPSENYGQAETSFLPLLFAVLALGKLYSEHEQGVDVTGYDCLTVEGGAILPLNTNTFKLT